MGRIRMDGREANQLSNVLDMSITGRPGIAATCDRRIRAPTPETSPKRHPASAYFALLSPANADVKGEALRDFETRSGLSKKEKERKQAELETEKAMGNKEWEFKGSKKGKGSG